MAVRAILKMGAASLLHPSVEVQDFAKENIAELIQDMKDTLQHEGGIGLAAPQIGVNKRIVILGGRDDAIPLTILINPKITPLSQEIELAFEACLSLPDLMGAVPRYKRIQFSALDAAGKSITHEVEDYHARVVQHECDHLDGVLYPMRLEDLTYFGYRDVLMARYSR